MADCILRFEEESSSKYAKRPKPGALPDRTRGSCPRELDVKFDSSPPTTPPISPRIPTSAEDSLSTTSLTNAVPALNIGPAYGQLLYQSMVLPLLLPPAVGGTSSSDERRQMVRASPSPSVKAGTSSSSNNLPLPFSGQFEMQGTEREEDLVPEGHLADLAGFKSPAQINQSVNKYFML